MGDMKEEELVALLLEGSIHSLEDRFLASLSQEMRAHCRETVRMQTNFLADVQRMLISTNQAEVLLYADRVRSSAMEVAHRWEVYRYMLQRYAERGMPPSVRIEVPSE